MIESIKNRVWDILKGKQVSLAMLFDRGGRILWHRGREIIGQEIIKGRGFSRSCAEAAMREGMARGEGEAVSRSGGNLPESARLLYVRSVLVVPAGATFFLYVDSGVKDGFSAGDAEVIRAMGDLLGETIDRFKAGASPVGSLSGVSPAMEQVREQVAKYALEEDPVLLLGETGVGKNHVAELIHRLSGRPGPLVVAHTPAIPATLFESEIFGHARGAFTDARERKPGLLEEAERGTLFLDEIAEVPPAFQTKLLQLIDTRRFRPLGETKERLADVRLIAATNRNLSDEVRGNAFRRDLYFRLNVLPLEIPPLRERRQDIRPLVEENIRLLRGKQIDAAGWEALQRHEWPGNVRELLHVLKRAGIMSAAPVIGADIAAFLESGLEEEVEAVPAPFAELHALRAAIAGGKSFWETAWSSFLARDLNRQQLRRFLEEICNESDGSLKKMAEKLNIQAGEYPRFISMLHRYGIHPRKQD